MIKKKIRYAALFSVILMATSGLVEPNQVYAAEKTIVRTADDLPRSTYELTDKPSVIVVEAAAPFDALKAQLDAEVRRILADYDIQDNAAKRELHTALRTVAFLDQKWDEVLVQSSEVAALENKKAAKAAQGLLSDPFAKAALKAGTPTSASFKKIFAAELAAKVSSLHYAETADTLQSVKGQFEILTLPLLIGSLESQLDPNAEAQSNVVDRGFVIAMLQIRQTIEFLSVSDVIVEVIGNKIESEKIEKVDLWTERTISLDDRKNLHPVIIGNWDSGLDPAVFPEQMWINESEVRNGKDDDGNGFIDDIHGPAFGYGWKRSTGALRPMPEADLADLDNTLTLLKGALDNQSAVNTHEAEIFRKAITSLKAEEVTPFLLKIGRLGLYIHGTGTAFTSVDGNPSAKLLHIRFDNEVKTVPSAFDEENAAAFVQYVEDSIRYLKTAGARVVNMSWRITTPQIESTLAAVEPDPLKRKERAAAIFETMNNALINGIKNAPEILFVAGAGNEDEDVEFVKSLPAGINLPNILTVGAVDNALEPASFTSYGKSIDLYANGFEVLTKVPGGQGIKLSGTSLSAPQVTNVAAKLWAIKPDLSVAAVRRIIEETATRGDDASLSIIYPKRALENL